MAGKDKPNFTRYSPPKSGPQNKPPAQPKSSQQFGGGQKQPHMDGRGQSGQPKGK